ncbi:MAG: alpha/beta fold hydrolase, partial [Acidimicrobiales bacterium]
MSAGRPWSGTPGRRRSRVSWAGPVAHVVLSLSPAHLPMLRSFASGALFGVAHGDGAPWSLALHGWQRTHADFDRVLGDGAAGGAVASLAVDLPGFGASPPPPSPWGSDDYAQATLGILRSMVDELGGPIVVLGHSFGGRVGVRLAVAAPELVSALVLSGVPLLAR